MAADEREALRPAAAGMVGPIWSVAELDRIEREAELRGYRKAITDLDHVTTRKVTADAFLNEFTTARGLLRAIAAHLEARLTEGGDGGA